MSFLEKHDFITLICLAFFPRLTLLFASFITGGVFWWLGWILAPHLLVAILSLHYWNTNPVLVIWAWIIAFEGTSIESKAAKTLRSSPPSAPLR